MEAAGGLTKVGRERAGTRDHIEQDVPLGAQNHQRTEPDIRIQAVAYNYHHEHWKCEVRGERRQKLRQRLYSLGKFWSESDPYSDRHPYQRRQCDQHDDARQRDKSVANSAEDIRRAQRRREIRIHLPGGVAGARDDNCKPESIDDTRWWAAFGSHPEAAWERDMQIRDGLVQGRKRICQRPQGSRTAEQIEHPGCRDARRRSLLEAEFVGPGYDRPKQ